MRLYVLRNPSVYSGKAVTDFLPVGETTMADAPTCHSCGTVVGLMPLLPPVQVELNAWGSQWGDIAFGPGDQLLVSAKLKALYQESCLVGLQYLGPVEVVKTKTTKRHAKRIGPPPTYELVSVVRGNALIDDIASGIVRERAVLCRECRSDGLRKADRIVLQPGTWSGEDIFFARGLPGIVLVTERFKALCESGQLTNCVCVAGDEYGFDFYRQPPDLVKGTSH